jgi:hypothetical protein
MERKQLIELSPNNPNVTALSYLNWLKNRLTVFKMMRSKMVGDFFILNSLIF